MKRLVCLISVSLIFFVSSAQTPSLAITTDKTVSLVFPFPIIHADRGTADVLVQPVKEASAILLVKAASENFPETNLTVVTEDGSVYSFKVTYQKDPAIWLYHLPIRSKAAVSTYASSILDNPFTMRGAKDHRLDMSAKVIGIYIKDNVIYYQLQLNNQGAIDYDIELLRFYIRDKKKGKRTAIQENEMKPLYIAGNTTQVKGNSISTIVVALEKFTIPDAKYLAIQIMEKNGGRHLSMKISNNKIIKALQLPDLK